jgi:hypothetical protein
MKKIFYLLPLAGLVYLLWYAYNKASGTTNATGAGQSEGEIKNAFKTALNYYPLEIVANAERIFRHETGHFKSGNFKRTNGAGFEAFSNILPYGWTSLKEFWTGSPHQPIGTIEQAENTTGKVKKFILFPSVLAGILAVCEILKLRNNNPGEYHSKSPAIGYQYEQLIKKVNPKYTIGA